MSTYIDLFSGIGGFALALHNISQPRLYCDIERSSQQVLIKLIKNESLPPAPVIYDVKNVRKAEQLRRAQGNPHSTGAALLATDGGLGAGQTQRLASQQSLQGEDTV